MTKPVAGVLLVLALASPALADEGGPPVTVSTTIAGTDRWRDEVRAVGTVRAVRGADLSSEVSGIVDQINFDSGTTVAAGTILVRLRPNDDQAKLAELEAAAELAAENQVRDGKQFRAQAVSQATLDADDSHLRAARAEVAQQQALMAEKVVRAPFAGKLGLRQIDLGQYVPAGTAMVTLQALDPVYVDFYVPQQALAGLAEGGSATVTVDAFPGRRFQARLAAISPKVDPSTRMAQLRSTVANPDHALLPGMFANVSVDSGAPHDYVTLPNAALVYSTYGTSIYVVKNGAAEQRPVTTGPTRGDQVAITRGLAAGETVVTAGQIKLRPGARVAINNSVQPTDNPNPHPAEE